ncbi:unnamed protein product [Chrysoparadoxa australica]
MALWLLYEKSIGNASSFESYIKALPAEVDLPMSWSSEELSELQYQPVVDSSSVLKDHILHQHELLLERSPETGCSSLSAQEFLDAITVVFSRTIQIKGRDEVLRYVMAPMIDMLNHQSDCFSAFAFAFPEGQDGHDPRRRGRRERHRFSNGHQHWHSGRHICGAFLSLSSLTPGHDQLWRKAQSSPSGKLWVCGGRQSVR